MQNETNRWSILVILVVCLTSGKDYRRHINCFRNQKALRYYSKGMLFLDIKPNSRYSAQV